MLQFIVAKKNLIISWKCLKKNRDNKIRTKAFFAKNPKQCCKPLLYPQKKYIIVKVIKK